MVKNFIWNLQLRKNTKGKNNAGMMGDYCWFLQKQSETNIIALQSVSKDNRPSIVF